MHSSYQILRYASALLLILLSNKIYIYIFRAPESILQFLLRILELQSCKAVGLPRHPTSRDGVLLSDRLFFARPNQQIAHPTT